MMGLRLQRGLRPVPLPTPRTAAAAHTGFSGRWPGRWAFCTPHPPSAAHRREVYGCPWVTLVFPTAGSGADDDFSFPLITTSDVTPTGSVSGITLLTIYKTSYLTLLFYILHLLFHLYIDHHTTLDQPSF